jgi:hypothetical protein
MAAQVVACDLTVQPGTPATAPLQATVPQAGGWISRIILVIPAGHNSLTGWALVLTGTVIVPYSGVGWIIGNDHMYEWQLDRYCNEGQLVVQGYNTGVFAHTFYFLADWDPAEPALGVTASIEASTPVSDATTSAVAGIAGPAPDDLTAAVPSPVGL